MVEMDEAAKPKDPKKGRHTINDGWLSGNRDALLNMFAFGWPEIGWQLAAVENRHQLGIALQPLREHTNRQYIDRLLRQTSAIGNEYEISPACPPARTQRRMKMGGTRR